MECSQCSSRVREIVGYQIWSRCEGRLSMAEGGADSIRSCHCAGAWVSTVTTFPLRAHRNQRADLLHWAHLPLEEAQTKTAWGMMNPYGRLPSEPLDERATGRGRRISGHCRPGMRFKHRIWNRIGIVRNSKPVTSPSQPSSASRASTTQRTRLDEAYTRAPLVPQVVDGAAAPLPDRSDPEHIPIRIHPRVFAALGADLVTNDVVAVMELVKNSYDAFARNVRIRFGSDESGNEYMEIEDDGTGMSRQVIEDAWCCVATPYRTVNRLATRGEEARRVVGEKGLGRLAVARIGNRLRMLTQAARAPCWEVTVDWKEVQESDQLSRSFVRCTKSRKPSPFQESGTCIRVTDLRGRWDEARVADLRENLARLISPFSGVDDFSITCATDGEEEAKDIQIETLEFLAAPKYSVRGEVERTGSVKALYRFAPIKSDKVREEELELSWESLSESVRDRLAFPFSAEGARCGPFSFEIRAWDIDSDGTEEISERFDLRKSAVRKSIRAHKGISVYRDGVLILPKSEVARDWLGLDFRRISKVGSRLSTSQIVGYVGITADENPGIDDTSDRERLVSSPQVSDFMEIIKAVVGLLENERLSDRAGGMARLTATQLFDGMSADSVVREVAELAKSDARASEVVPVLSEFQKTLNSAREEVQRRFVYYSRLATVGTIAHMLVHEIRGRTTAYGAFLEFVQERFSPFKDSDLQDAFDCADRAVDALEHLADTFAPLASRQFRRRKRHSILEERIKACLALLNGDISRKRARCEVPSSETAVAVDPGELDAILLNLVANAIFWLGEVPKENRRLSFGVARDPEQADRVRVRVSDQGPGIGSEDLERVFWPGFTRKPGGIGMGLTVASELVAAYGGRTGVEATEDGVGATFVFDLPLRDSDG